MWCSAFISHFHPYGYSSPSTTKIYFCLNPKYILTQCHTYDDIINVNVCCLASTRESSHADHSVLATTTFPAMASVGPVQAGVRVPPRQYREVSSGCVSWPSGIAVSKRSTMDSREMWEVSYGFLTACSSRAALLFSQIILLVLHT